MDLDPETIAKSQIVLASFFGGVIRLFLRPASSFLKSLWLVLCCVICGYYFTPIAMDVFSFDEEWTGAIGALIGLVGLSIADALVNLNYHRILEVWAQSKQPSKD